MAPASDDGRVWREHRTEAAATHAKELGRRKAAESARARELIAEFVRKATSLGIPPVRLRARSYDGRSRYRTATHGWYLRRNESVAVGTNGEFYLLTVPASLRARMGGAELEPSDPPLVLGKGARDGESIDLTDALAIVLGEAERRT
jgi:hypothetical protein